MNIYVVATSFPFHSLHAIGIIQSKFKRTDRKGIDNLSFCNLYFSILYIYILLRWFSLRWKIQCWIIRCRVFHNWIIAIAVIQLWGRINCIFHFSKLSLFVPYSVAGNISCPLQFAYNRCNSVYLLFVDIS